MSPTGNASTQPNAPNSIARPPRLALYFVHPAEFAGRVVELANGLVVGREPLGQTEPPFQRAPGEPPAQPKTVATVHHATVSRRHASVAHGFGVPILTDLGSSNGTRVNGEVVSAPTALVLQSVVRFGDVLAVVDEYAGPDVVAESPLGRSPRMARLCSELERAARETVPVLVLGETGTGKEWIAAEVHRRSGRPGPYVKLNSAELSPQLVESELFGHERGAFTGAVSKHVGLFVEADRGTLFLDEIGELPLDLQAKLLRVLQEGEVRPVGSTRIERTTTRVVGATNRDLAADVEEGRFRRDLFARLSYFELRLPPLRERRQDVLWWVERFAARWGEERGKTVELKLQPAVVERILLHDWLDNLRGLERLVHRLSAGDPQQLVGMSALVDAMPEFAGDARPAGGARPSQPSETAPDAAKPNAARAVSDRPTREEFLAVYEAAGRSIRATSKHFGRDRRQVYRWLEAFGIER